MKLQPVSILKNPSFLPTGSWTEPNSFGLSVLKPGRTFGSKYKNKKTEDSNKNPPCDNINAKMINIIMNIFATNITNFTWRFIKPLVILKCQ